MYSISFSMSEWKKERKEEKKKNVGAVSSVLHNNNSPAFFCCFLFLNKKRAKHIICLDLFSNFGWLCVKLKRRKEHAYIRNIHTFSATVTHSTKIGAKPLEIIKKNEWEFTIHIDMHKDINEKVDFY